MGKTKLFVVGYSLVLTALFITFLVLLLHVNPPLKVDQETIANVSAVEEDYLYADELKFPSNIKLVYGLAKGYNENNSDENYSYYNKLLEELKDIKNTVAPPVWPPKLWKKTAIEPNGKSESGNIKKDCRRSVKEDMMIRNLTKPLLVNIINMDKTKIEIKLPSDVMNETKDTLDELKPNEESTIEEIKLKVVDDKIVIFNITDNVIRLINKLVNFSVTQNGLSHDQQNISKSNKNETSTYIHKYPTESDKENEHEDN